VAIFHDELQIQAAKHTPQLPSYLGVS